MVSANSARHRYVVNNAVISVAISMVISAAFFFAVFGQQPLIAVFGMGGLAFDFIPQTLAAGFMAAFVPAMQTRARMKSGAIAGQPPRTAGVIGCAAKLALAGLVLAAAVTGVLWLLGIGAMGWTAALILKVAYGGLLGLIITPLALNAILQKG